MSEPSSSSPVLKSGGEFSPTSPRVGPLSAVLIGISIVVAIISQLGKDDAILEHLWITATDTDDGFSLPEILHGQVWRLITPIFMHFGIMHLVFNMLWLKDLGTMVEKRVNTRTLLLLVLVTGVFANLVEFFFGGPFFGGMSGVVYALLGYVWMKSKFDPASGLFLEKQTVIMMIVWFGLCLTGMMGPVANYAHGAGLAAGMLWGFLSAKSR